MACLSKPCGKVTEPAFTWFHVQFPVANVVIPAGQTPDSRWSRFESVKLFSL